MNSDYKETYDVRVTEIIPHNSDGGGNVLCDESVDILPTFHAPASAMSIGKLLTTVVGAKSAIRTAFIHDDAQT